MGHYCGNRYHIQSSDFTAHWKAHVPYQQDGCTKIEFVNTNNDKATAKSKKDGEKYIDEHEAPSYTCRVYDCGVVAWESVRTVRKIVNHHVQNVEESRTYKSKPTTGLKGGRIRAVHDYCISFDGRCYEQGEHGSFCTQMHDEYTNY